MFVKSVKLLNFLNIILNYYIIFKISHTKFQTFLQPVWLIPYLHVFKCALPQAHSTSMFTSTGMFTSKLMFCRIAFKNLTTNIQRKQRIISVETIEIFE